MVRRLFLQQLAFLLLWVCVSLQRLSIQFFKDLIEFSELLIYLAAVKLTRVMDDVPQKHVSKEVPRWLCRMTLHEDVQVAERRAAVADSRVRVSHVERANELAVVDEFDLLVVPLEELRDSASEEVHLPVGERVVANTDASCLFQRFDECLVRVVVQVVDHEVDSDSAFGCVDHFLKSNAGHGLVIHVVSRNADTVLGIIDLVPQQIPKPIVILVNAHFPRALTCLRLLYLVDHFIFGLFEIIKTY